MTRRLLWAGLVVSLVSCGSDERSDNVAVPGADIMDGQDVMAAGGGAQTPIGMDGQTPAAVPQPEQNVPVGSPTDNPIDGLLISKECQGLNFEGMIYSPGGDNLPNICEPYHGTLNSAYAVRCIDAWPWYATQFPGDEYCVLPPAPDKGHQFGLHPQGNFEEWFAQVSTGDMSGYASPAAEFVMGPGEEQELNYTGGSTNQPFNFYRSNTRMRAGSHHMINSIADSGATQGTWGPGDAIGGLLGMGLPGAQRPDQNTPNTLEKPAEDAGLYSVFPASPKISYNLHHFNPTDGMILKEAWINLWFEDDATIRTSGIFGMPLTQVFSLRVSPEQTVDLHHSFNISSPVRVIALFGHRHAWTTNFSVWIEEGGQNEIIYQSFDWFDQPTYRYDSTAQNPPPQPDLLTDGGTSGVLVLMPGQELHFNCHIEYTAERAALVNAPTPPSVQGGLTFTNEAFTGEMCILFGTTAMGDLGMPSADGGAVPSFATVD